MCNSFKQRISVGVNCKHGPVYIIEIEKVGRKVVFSMTTPCGTTHVKIGKNELDDVLAMLERTRRW